MSDGLWTVAMRVASLPLWTRKARNRILRLIGVAVSSSASIADNVRVGSSLVTIGAESFINCDCILDGCAELVIGEQVSIGPRVTILTGSHAILPTLPRADPHSLVARPVRVENGCWIGAGAIILPGVTVASGCVVGAGAVVTGSTEPNGVYVGVPARRIKDLPTGQAFVPPQRALNGGSCAARASVACARRRQSLARRAGLMNSGAPCEPYQS